MTDGLHPVSWPEGWGSPEPRRRIAFLWLSVGLAVGALACVVLSQGAAGPLASGIVLVLVSVTAFLVFARAPFGSAAPRIVSTRGLPETWRASGDSTVHLVPERSTGAVLLLVCTVWAIVFSITTVIAVRIGLEGRPAAFVGAGIVALFAVLFVFAAVRSAIRQVRGRTGSANPLGLGIGASGLTVAVVGSTLFIPWTAVRAVEAEHTVPRLGMPETPLLRLRFDPRGVVRRGRAGESGTLTLSPGAYRIHPAALWSALQVGRRNAAVRRQFGTASGDLLFRTL